MKADDASDALKEGEIMTQKEFRKAAALSEENAQRSLFDEYFNYVYTIVFSRLRSCASREDIEECVGDVFADVYMQFDERKAFNGDPTGFVGTVARRKAADIYNRLTKKRQGMVSIDDEEAAEIEAPEDTEDTVEKKELRSSLIKCVEQLGEPDSTIILQKFFFMRSSAEISKLVSMTPEAVRVRCSRALKKLRETLTAMNISL
ncbi:RNA polymerase sigma factor [Ruminococcus flavefaciens]|uniref:RNA polymerase sigma factor n=1 Tax=Ruminococcus flavefaciens TaxID=1265 RepID=UPI001FA72E3C|nr:sigma-70 family RNA polymerase sigma factor [Ruminococcus flavefaciens]